MVALANRTISKAERLAAEFGVSPYHVYSNHLELIEKERLDFVDIATAPPIHRRQVEAAAAHGMNVLCQKPFAPTLKEARAMMSACRRAGVLLSINENWRWRGWYREVKRLLDGGAVGRPRYACIRLHSGLVVPDPNGNPPRIFLDQPSLRGMDRLIVYEWGVHLVDVLRFLFGEVESVFARLDKVHPQYSGEERAVLALDMGGVSGLVDISWATIEAEKVHGPLEQVTIEGDEGTIEILPDQGNVLQVTTRGEVRRLPVLEGAPEEAYQESFTAAQRHFIQCLRDGRAPETSAEDNIKTLAVVFAAYDSAARNRVIVTGKRHARG